MRCVLFALLVLVPALAATPRAGRCESRPWAQAKSFVMQLEGLDPDAVCPTGFEIVITDYSRDGTDGGAYSKGEIAALGSDGAVKKRVLACVGIGGAERRRFYWKKEWGTGAPAFLDGEAPGGKGSFRVRYWDLQWRNVLVGWLDRALEAGFDGVCLDGVEAFEYYEKRGMEDAREEMAGLVLDLAAYCRGRAGGEFGVFIRGGERLVDDSVLLGAITGIVRDETYYKGESERPAGESRMVEALLDRAKGAGKLVLTLDFCRKPAHVKRAYARARAKGYVEYCTVRALDALTLNEGFDPPPAP